MTPVRNDPSRLRGTGFSLVEISLVIALILGMGMLVGLSVGSVREWQRGKDASLSLQAVYAAQRSYLADHPTADLRTLAAAALVPYLPEGWSALPTATALTGESLSLDHTVMPPVFKAGDARYDPSKSTGDGLWDTGE
jgi:type II secretory pathway pseudopilin PulG